MTTAHAAKRVLAHALLAVHLVVFVLGGAFVARAPAQGSIHRAVIAAVTGAGDGAAVTSPSDGRLERAARPRADRGERGGAPPLDFVVASSTLTIAPASLTGAVEIAPASAPYRLLPSVVHGPRGPPHAC
jgi:hypothetical protein